MSGTAVLYGRRDSAHMSIYSDLIVTALQVSSRINGKDVSMHDKKRKWGYSYLTTFDVIFDFTNVSCYKKTLPSNIISFISCNCLIILHDMWKHNKQVGIYRLFSLDPGCFDEYE